MEHINRYCKEFFKSTFQRKSDLDIIRENIKNNPNGLFFSFFEINNKIKNEEINGKKTEIDYRAYHLFFGNDTDNMCHITATDLAHQYQKNFHQQSIVNFNQIDTLLQKKIILNSNKISEFKEVDLAIEIIFDKVKEKIPFFTVPDDKDYYQNLSIVFFKNKISLNFLNTSDKIKHIKI